MGGNIIKKIINLLLCGFIILFIYSIIYINIQHKDLEKKIKLNNYFANISKDGYHYLNIIDEYRDLFHNDDIEGILNIDSLDISSLIVKGSDNSYYLNHLENKDKSIYGSLMLDYRTNLDDNINIIYGHTSGSSETVFNRLSKYLDKDFYDNNKNIEIISSNNKYVYEVFSVGLVDKSEYRQTIINYDIEQLNWYKDISIYDDSSVSIGEDILILQTCYSDKFLLVIAKK